MATLSNDLTLSVRSERKTIHATTSFIIIIFVSFFFEDRVLPPARAEWAVSAPSGLWEPNYRVRISRVFLLIYDLQKFELERA